MLLLGLATLEGAGGSSSEGQSLLCDISFFYCFKEIYPLVNNFRIIQHFIIWGIKEYYKMSGYFSGIQKFKEQVKRLHLFSDCVCVLSHV